MTDSSERAAQVDHQLRITSLATAQSTFGATGAPSLVLAAAKMYLAFLRGDPNA